MKLPWYLKTLSAMTATPKPLGHEIYDSQDNLICTFAADKGKQAKHIVDAVNRIKKDKAA